MKIVALLTVRNEEWILGMSLKALMMWVDEVVVFNHASTDLTGEIIRQLQEQFPDRIHNIRWSNPQWDEMSHRQIALSRGREVGGTHFVLVDADEVLSGNLLPSARKIVTCSGPGVVNQIPWITCWRSHRQYRSDPGKWGNQSVSFAFQDKPGLHWRARDDGYAFHHRHPYEAKHNIAWRDMGGGGLMHLQHANWRRLLAKQALYKMQEVVRWPGRESVSKVDARYSGTVSESGLRYTAVPQEWWEPYKDLMKLVQWDAEPWQEAECKRLWNLYGPETFKGLDLFGVVG